MSRIEQAIKQISAGNNSGITYIYEQFRDFLFKIARTYGLSIEDSEEITNDTFMKLLKEINGQKFEYKNDSSFISWLIKIQKNNIRMFFRKKRIEFEYMDNEENLTLKSSKIQKNSVEDPAPSDPKLSIIRNEIANLPEDDQILLT